MSNAQQLAALIRENQDELLSLWRKQVRQLPAAKGLDRPTLYDHIPVFLRELVLALENGNKRAIAENVHMGTPPAHALQRLGNGFDLEEVVAEYNILRGCIHDLAERHGLILQGEPFHILNFVLDSAIGAAVKSYTVRQALDVQRRREEYLAFVAHDLRTPLNAIALAASAVDGYLKKLDDDKVRKMLLALQRNVGYLTTLVHKVLEENLNMETESGIKVERRHFYLWPLVESLIHDLRPIAGTGSTALINRVPEDQVIYADALLVKRVLQNLIANAINHTPCGEVVVNAWKSENGVACEVRDNGTGIAPDRLPHIFDKYETGGKPACGFGLGLAICKTFVEAHGGTIAATSKPGEGTAFRFTLPDE